MASYQVTGRSSEGSPLVTVSVSSIDQDQQVISELDIVNAVRDRLKTVPGVELVVARKYEQVITTV
ncbi:hypothetical protein [Streptomyces sp. NPDC102476]|jgi:hypothetical protein|uniref:hypothetical protein n=1 Tax=Streptomyces sp. NPDC102476 TaxID=3366181 RepID=UPI0038307D11